jgi:hypothetical protein
MMRQLAESLGVFVLALGVWALFAWATATLAALLPGEEMIEFVGGMVSLLGLLAALGIAARIAGKRLIRSSDSRR